MDTKDDQTDYEVKLGHAMVKGHLISENQLKTALDYQRSLGGSLGDVLVRLGFLRETILTDFLARENLSVPPKSSGPPDIEEALLESGPAKKRARKNLPAELVPGVTEADPHRPQWAPNEVGEGLSLSPSDPVLRELVRLLAKKGVISPSEEEAIIEGGGSPGEA